ncbi:MAG: nuclear transport factor 2 family protein [Gammaproteobacteria bacterium]
MNHLDKLFYLDAVNEIKALKHFYFKACDNHDINSIRACFTKDVEINFEAFGEFKTIDSMLELYREKSIKDGQIECHFGKNPVITISGEKANGQWALSYTLFDITKLLLIKINGFYLDTYYCINGTWKIYSSTFKRSSSLIQKLS